MAVMDAQCSKCKGYHLPKSMIEGVCPICRATELTHLSCIGCGREDNLDSIVGDVWCHWCATEGPTSVLEIAKRMAPIGTRETIITEWKRLNSETYGNKPRNRHTEIEILVSDV